MYMLFDLVIILKTPEKVHCHFGLARTCFCHVKTASLHDLLTALHKFQNKEEPVMKPRSVLVVG